MTNKLLGAGLAVAAVCCWAQQVDLSSLDKLEARAKSVNKVNLDSDQLRAASSFASEKGVPKDVLDKMEGVQIRDLEFAKTGQYSDSDLDSVRKQVAALPGCTKVIDSKEDNEHSEIYMCTGANNKMHGLAIVDAEPRELSVVIVRGIASLADIGKLNGLAGLPKVQAGPPAPPNPPAPQKNDK